MTDIYLTIKPKNQRIAHRWSTSIMRTITGPEQRAGIFTWPRTDVDLAFRRGDEYKTNWFRRHLSKSQHKIWGIPLWHDDTDLSAQATASSAVIPCVDTSYRRYYPGRKVILIDKTDWTTYEEKEILSVTASTITCTSLLANTWEKESTYVMPLYDFRIGRQNTISRQSARMDDLFLEAEEDVTTIPDFTYSLPATTSATYNGYPIFDQIIQDRKQISFMHPYDLRIGAGLGAFNSYYSDDDTHINQDVNAFVEGREEIWNVSQFFDNRMGKLEPFWVPTWNRDLVATEAVASSATGFAIRDYDYETLFYGNTVINRHLFIGLPDRTYVTRQIVDASPSRIELSSPIGEEIRESQLQRLLLSFLVFSRFSTDRLEIDYVRGNLANIRLGTFGLIGEQ